MLAALLITSGGLASTQPATVRFVTAQPVAPGSAFPGSTAPGRAAAGSTSPAPAPFDSASTSSVNLYPTSGTAARSDDAPFAAARATPALFLDLSLSAGRLTWLRATGASSDRIGTLWQRNVALKAGSRTRITEGPAKKVVVSARLAGNNPYLYSRAVVSASADRVLVPPLSSSGLNSLAYQMFDGRTRSHTATIGVWENYGVRQSGPYAVVGRRVYRADGTLMLNLDKAAYPRLDVFGPRVVYSTDDGLVRLRDLSKPVSTSNPKILATNSRCRPTCNLEVAIWGDRVAWARPGGTAVIRTLSTGRDRVVRTGSLIGLRLSEGALSWHNSWHDDSITLLNLGSAHSTPQVLPLRSAEVDGHLVAGLDPNTGQIVVRPLPFGLRTHYRPRVLGVLAAPGFHPQAVGAGRTWSPQIDVSAPVRSVRMAISRDGVPIRTLTAAAPVGSIRDLAWDGDDQSGAPQPSGDYQWTLTATATDGEGELIAGDGAGTVSGTVAVMR